MPVVNGRDLTVAAVNDVLNQTVPTRLLIVGQGCDWDLRQELEKISEEHSDRVFCWWYQPALPALALAWNTALRFVWEVGGTDALVVNSDVRLHPQTIECLRTPFKYRDAYFVSAVGVMPDQFNPTVKYHGYVGDRTDEGTIVAEPEAASIQIDAKGGPDFSCFLISKDCHERYQFDEGHVPCYAEDCSFHRSMMLGGDGTKIFSINLPYAHYASGTLKAMNPERRQAIEHQINTISRKWYETCWGGPVNHERFTIKGEPASAQDGVTNPDLQRAILGH